MLDMRLAAFEARAGDISRNFPFFRALEVRMGSVSQIKKIY